LIPEPVRVRTDDHESLGALLGPGIVLTAGDVIPAVGEGVRVQRSDTAHDGRVVWRDPSSGAALVDVDGGVGSARVRWGVLPEGPRVPCAVLTGDGPVRTALVPDGDGPAVDTRDIDREVTGAALVCGDLLLGVAVPGPDTPVLTASELLAVPEVRDILADHGLSDRADRVGSAVPADTDVDLARERLRTIVSAPPPSDPTEYARLTDTCLGLARALPHELLLAAASSAERPGPLHAALDRLIADPDTPVEVFMDLVLFDVRGLEAWEADVCAVAARRLEVADVPSEHEAARAEGTVRAHHLAARLMGRQGRFAAGSDAVTALRGFLRGLPDDEHDRYRTIEMDTLWALAVALADAEKLREAEGVLGDLVDSCVAAAERGVVGSRSQLVDALLARSGALVATGLAAEALRSATEAVRVCEELRVSAPDSHTQDLANAHLHRASVLRYLGREDEAAAAEALSQEAREQGPEVPTTPAMSVRLLASRGREHAVAGRHTEALAVFTDMVRIVRAEDVRGSGGRAFLVMGLLGQGDALFATGHKERALEAFAEAVDVCRQGGVDLAGPGSSLMMPLVRHARLLHSMGRTRAVLAATIEIEDLAGEVDLGAGVLASGRAESAAMRAFTLRFLGRDREALDAAETALGLIADLPGGSYVRGQETAVRGLRDTLVTTLEQSGSGPEDPAGDPLRTGVRLSDTSVVQLNSGLFDMALGMASEAIEILRSSGEEGSEALKALAQAHAVRAWAHPGNALEAAVADAEAALHLMRNGAEGAAPRFLNSTLRTRGWALSLLERWEEAVPALVESVASTRAEVERGGAPSRNLADQVGLLARAYTWLGRHHDALPHAAEAVALGRAIVASGDDPDAAGELLGRYLTYLAFPLWKVGDAEAVTVAEEAVRVLEGLGERTPARDRTLGEARQLLDAVRDPGGSAAE
jgi:tetratricopeptide (TPR) repeat protein